MQDEPASRRMRIHGPLYKNDVRPAGVERRAWLLADQPPAAPPRAAICIRAVSTRLLKRCLGEKLSARTPRPARLRTAQRSLCHRGPLLHERAVCARRKRPTLSTTSTACCRSRRDIALFKFTCAHAKHSQAERSFEKGFSRLMLIQHLSLSHSELTLMRSGALAVIRNARWMRDCARVEKASSARSGET